MFSKVFLGCTVVSLVFNLFSRLLQPITLTTLDSPGTCLPADVRDIPGRCPGHFPGTPKKLKTAFKGLYNAFKGLNKGIDQNFSESFVLKHWFS